MKNRWTLAAVAAVIVICIASALWFAIPARAMTISVTAPPSGTLGQTFSFTAAVNVQNSDLLPVNHIDLQIYNTSDPATGVTCPGLPLPQGSNQTASQDFTNSGGTFSISGTSDGNWGYGYSHNPYGYGYGYQSGTYNYGYQNYPPSYGYGYNAGSGQTSISYAVNWIPPTNWTPGTYAVKALVYGGASDSYFTNDSSVTFTLAASIIPPAVTTFTSGWNSQGNVFKDGIFPTVPGTVIKIGPSYFMYYGRNTTGNTWEIALAMSNSPSGPWSAYSGDPVLSPGSSWDSLWINDANVVLDNGTYYMFYEGNNGQHSGIGYATSSDGKTWVKQTPDKALLENSSDPLNWDSVNVGTPFVVKSGSTYYLYYHGYSDTSSDRIGYATSSSITGPYVKYSGNPVLVPSLSGWDSNWCGQTAIFNYSNTWLMFYEASYLPGDAGGVDVAQVGLAYSSDLSSWNKYSGNPVFKLESGNSRDNPVLYSEDNNYYVYMNSSPSAYNGVVSYSMITAPNGGGTSGSGAVGGGGGGGGGGSMSPPKAVSTVVNGSTYVNVAGMVDSQGRFTQPVAAVSADNTVQLNINAGVIGMTKDGLPLSQISLVPMPNSPAPPAQTNLIGLTYNLGPEGATFSPPVSLTFNYDPTALAPGLDPQTLALAYYDTPSGLWINLSNIAVDIVNHTVTGATSHFTPFSIVARIPILTTAPTIHSQPTTSPPATQNLALPTSVAPMPPLTIPPQPSPTGPPTPAVSAPSTVTLTKLDSGTGINVATIIGIITAILIIAVIILLVIRRK